MKEKIKNYLGMASIFALITFAYAAFIYADAYSKSIQPSSFRSFSATAEGKAVAKPDIAKFSFSVITEGGKDMAALQKENTEKTNQAIEFLKSGGIDAKDIKTLNYNLEPRYQYYSCPINNTGSQPCPPAEIVGYKIIQNVSVKIRDFSKIGDFVSGVVKNGANEVSQLSFDIDNLTNIQNQAREEAIKKAKEKAENIAKSGDFRLGRLLSIEENGPTPVYGYGMGVSTAKSFETVAISAPTIEPGSQEIIVNITLRYEIE
ncbi:SIMPL domain-containing protein [Candidatus Wolfebacteria bacterium]|nr:SIMPL domain-containing protein [Candidatus Wolfebacteria bacterium]